MFGHILDILTILALGLSAVALWRLALRVERDLREFRAAMRRLFMRIDCTHPPPGTTIPAPELPDRIQSQPGYVEILGPGGFSATVPTDSKDARNAFLRTGWVLRYADGRIEPGVQEPEPRTE